MQGAFLSRSEQNMWLRKAVRFPFSLFGTVTVLSLTAVAFPVWFLSGALRESARSKPDSGKRRRRLMPEVYDAKEVADMLQMVQAAMQHKSQQLLLEMSASEQSQQQVDTLRESLENMSYLFAQVSSTLACLMSTVRTCQGMLFQIVRNYT